MVLGATLMTAAAEKLAALAADEELRCKARIFAEELKRIGGLI